MTIGWQPTHRTISTGATTWAAPDPAAAHTAPLDAHLDVIVVEQLPYGWTRVRCENGWETWVSADSLTPASPGAPAPPGTGTAAATPPGTHPGTHPPVAYAPIEFAGAAAPRPAPSRVRVLLPVFGVVVIAAIGAARYLLARQSDPASEATLRTLSLTMVVLMIAMFGISLLGVRDPARSRPALDVLRAAFTLGAVIVMGAVTNSSLAPALLAVALIVATVAGGVEGSLRPAIVGSDGRRYALPAIVPMVVSFVGLLTGVLAAVGDARSFVQVGQVIAIAGTGLMLGVAIVRFVPPGSVPRLSAGMLAFVSVSAMVTLPVLVGAWTAGADTHTAFDGEYTGSFELPSAPDTKITRNEISLVLEELKLTGTLAIASKQTFAIPDEFAGLYPACLIMIAELSGSELTGVQNEDGRLVFSGTVQFAGDIKMFTTPAEASDPCTSAAAREPLVTAQLSITVSDSGLTGTLSGTGDSAQLLDEVNLRAERTGGATPPSTDRTTGTSATDGEDGGTSTTNTTRTTRRTPPTSVTPSSVEPAPRQPATTFLGAPGQPITPKDATEVAVDVVIALAGAGAITAAQAGAARNALENGAVPADVLADLGRRNSFDSLGTKGAIDALGIQTNEQILQTAKDKLNDVHSDKTLTADQFREYLKELERTVPWADRKQIIAALHATEYPGDVGGTLPGTSIKLFEQGPETAGHQEIVPWLGASQGRSAANDGALTNITPKFMVDKSGNVVDFMHAMAGVRSDLNRPPGYLENLYRGSGIEPPNARNVMRWANTHGGDSWQEVVHAPESSWKHGDLRWANEYAPPNQRLGNDMGVWLSDFYRNPANDKIPLSKAVDIFSRSTAGAGPGRTSYFHPE